MGIKHTFTSPVPDTAGPTVVKPSNWNDDHTIDGDVNFNGHAIVNASGISADFLGLSDTPNAFTGFGGNTGDAGALVRVNAAANALVFKYSTPEYIDLRDYGMATSGSNINITASLQAALNDLSNTKNTRIRIPLVGNGTVVCDTVTFPGGVGIIFGANESITIEIDCIQVRLSATWNIPGSYSIKGMGRNRAINFPHPYGPLPRPEIISHTGAHITLIHCLGQNCSFENLNIHSGGIALYLHSAEICVVRNCAFGSESAFAPLKLESTFWVQLENISCQPRAAGDVYCMEVTTDEDWGKNNGILLIRHMICHRNGLLFRSVFGPSGVDNTDIERLHSEGLVAGASLITFDSTVRAIGGFWLRDLENSDALGSAYFIKNIGGSTDGVVVDGFNKPESQMFAPGSTPIKNFVMDFTKRTIGTSEQPSSLYYTNRGTSAARSHQLRTPSAIDVRLLTAPVGIPWTQHTPLAVIQDPANWITTGQGLTGTVTPGFVAPDGSTMAGRVTVGIVAAYNTSHAIAVGDYFIAGVWVRTSIGTGAVIGSSRLELIGAGGNPVIVDGGQGGDFSSELHDRIRNNGWRWVCEAMKITGTSGGAASPAVVQHRLFPGYDFFAPCLTLIPAATVATMDEVWLLQYARALKGGWSSNALTGEPSFLDHQTVKMGHAGSSGGLKANKIATPAAGTKLISAGVISATGSFHTVDTEAAAASDDLDTINGGTDGARLVLVAANTARTVVVKDGTGNIRLTGDFSLDNTEDTIELVFSSVANAWLELSRSDNGA